MNLLPGDFAIVNGHQYQIRSIQPEGIYIETPNESGISLIILDQDRWQVQNYDQPHEVTFKRQYIELTGIEEIDIEILLKLDATDLENLCRDNLSSLCQNERFWMFKVLRDFGQKVFENKPIHETYKEQYWYLQNALKEGDVSKEIRANRFDALLVIEHLITTFRSKRNLGDIAAGAGNIKILELLKKYNIYPIHFYHGQYPIKVTREVLEWALLQNSISKQAIYLSAVSNGYLDIIIKLDEMGIIPVERIISRAFEMDQLEILEWFKSKKFDLRNFMPAAKFGHLHLLRWMIDNGLLNINGGRILINIANIAASYGHINILEWLEQMNIYPTRIKFKVPLLSMTDELEWIKKFTIPTLEWLRKRDLLPSTVDISGILASTLFSKDFTLLNWFESKQIRYSYDPNGMELRGLIRRAIVSKRLDILEWFEQHGYIFNSNDADFAKNRASDEFFTHGWAEYLDWLAKRGIYPTNQ